MKQLVSLDRMGSKQRLQHFGSIAWSAANDCLDFFFPRLCEGCDRGLLREESGLCLFCAAKLPRTHFWELQENPVMRLFHGRLPLDGATAFLHFSEGGMTQNLIHRMKYKGQRKLCQLLGSMFAKQLKHRGLLSDVDVIVPVPLHPVRERRRGYNQSALVGHGLAEHIGGVVMSDVVVRAKSTDTQTRKARFDRSVNMQDVFICVKPEMLRGKTVLIVDDVVTTGSTIEGVGHAVRSAGASRLYVLAIAFPN